MLSLAALGAPRAAHAQPGASPVRIEVRDAGPGEAGRLLRGILSRPHVVLAPRAATLALPRDTTITTTIVIVGADVTVASRVDGDVVVVDGDLFLRPGATIRGRAIAIGGGVYNSLLARVEGGLVAYRDASFDVAAEGATIALSYRAQDAEPMWRVSLPGLYGLRLPSYSRVDGLTLEAGPRVSAAHGAFTAEPRLAYRSHLGTLDPGLTLRLSLDRRTELETVAERGTFTNDAWARHDLVNSAATLIFGDDERNYYRATHIAATLRRRWEGTAGTVEPWIAAQAEDAWSVGPVRGTTGAPWSMTGRRDTLDMLRPNPLVLDGRVTSVLGGVRASWDDGDLLVRGHARAELPVATPDDRRFAQLTLDASAAFRTVRSHRLELAGHAVLTAGDVAVPQRFAYLGGGSTIPTVRELSMGGDQLLFVEGSYLVPLARPALPYLGPPTVGVHYVAGSAGIDGLPAFVQNVGLRLMVSFLRLDVLVDPASGETAVGVGVAGFR